MCDIIKEGTNERAFLRSLARRGRMNLHLIFESGRLSVILYRQIHPPPLDVPRDRQILRYSLAKLSLRRILTNRRLTGND